MSSVVDWHVTLQISSMIEHVCIDFWRSASAAMFPFADKLLHLSLPDADRSRWGIA